MKKSWMVRIFILFAVLQLFLIVQGFMVQNWLRVGIGLGNACLMLGLVRYLQRQVLDRLSFGLFMFCILENSAEILYYFLSGTYKEVPWCLAGFVVCVVIIWYAEKEDSLRWE